MKKFLKKIFAPAMREACFQQVRPEFYDLENTAFRGRYRWIDASAIRCTPGEYEMIGIKSNGYIISENGAFFPLSSVSKIFWYTLREVKVMIPCSEWGDVHYTNEEVEMFVQRAQQSEGGQEE